MLADPFLTNSTVSAITSSGALALPAISRGDSSSSYRLLAFGDENTVLDLFVGHTYAKRNRTTFKFTVSSVVSDPLVSGISSNVSNSYYFVADESPIYLPATRAPILSALALNLLLVGSTAPMINRVLAGET